MAETKQTAPIPPDDDTASSTVADSPAEIFYYRINFRPQNRPFTALAHQDRFKRGQVVMVRTEHGPEPARVASRISSLPFGDPPPEPPYLITRDATLEEEGRFERLLALEGEALAICAGHIQQLALPMQLVRVERYFSGGKIIFYFTAENRVDFRELVKALVHEFRIRVEMRQIGVRHETQMIGGIGACGRELCCATFLDHFDSVSIKMAKEQDLPLNPTKISGVCNRLLCCLTYEFDTYRNLKKGMPRAGRSIRIEDQVYLVIRQMPLQSSVLVVNKDGEERTLSHEEWQAAEPIKGGAKRGPRKKQP
jgi:cell fate regulator YaaT (PSP1 superfamily)